MFCHLICNICFTYSAYKIHATPPWSCILRSALERSILGCFCSVLYDGAAVVVHGHMHCLAYTCWSNNVFFPILCAWIGISMISVGLRCSHALQLARYGKIGAVTCNVNFSLA